MPAAPFHTHAAIISTGDELVIGQALDTNSRWLSDRLMSLGIEPVEHITLGDDLAPIAAALRRLAAAVPLIITTGGLGPTLDDVTRESLADVLGEELVTDQRALDRLERRFAARARVMTDNQRRQAQRPASATCIDNANGTAPGLHAVIPGAGPHGGTDVFCLPGPPAELAPMFERDIVPRLRIDPARSITTRLLHLIGIGEGDAAAKLGDLLARAQNPLVGITASGGIVTLRIRNVSTSGPAGADEAAHQIAQIERAARDFLAPHIFGDDDDTLAGVIVRTLTTEHRALSTVESCTGGLLASMITAIPGSSAAFRGGWITYSNELKSAEVGVSPDILAAHGAVSEQTAHAMAVGGLERAWRGDAPAIPSAPGPAGRHCLSITGIAGPDGGTPAKPVGTVYIAHAWTSAASHALGPQVEVRRFLFPGDREDVRSRAAVSALAMLYFGLAAQRAGPRTLLWESGPPAPQ